MKYCATLVFLVGAAAASINIPPQVAQQYDSDYYVFILSQNASFGGHLANNADLNLQRMVQFQKQVVVETISIYNEQTQYQVFNGEACDRVPTKSSDNANWFGWLPESSYIGQEKIDNVNCNVWAWESGDIKTAAWFVVDGADFPVQWSVKNDAADLEVVYKFFNWVSRSQPASYFRIPSQCNPDYHVAASVNPAELQQQALTAASSSVNRQLAARD